MRYGSCQDQTEKQGFVLNRLQGAVLAEALRLLHEDVISVEDLDKTMKDGLGMRWAFMGPFETIELNAPEGADDYFQRYCSLFRDMAAEPPGQTVFDPSVTKTIVQNWKTRLGKDDILRRTAWRNERLASLSAWKKQRNQERYSVRVKERMHGKKSDDYLCGYGRNSYPLHVSAFACHAAAGCHSSD